MSFSSDIKNELCFIEDMKPCCRHAQNYGMLLFSHFSKYNFSFTTENENVFKLYNSIVTGYCGAKLCINENGKKKQTAYIEDLDEMKRVFDTFGHTIDEGTIRIAEDNIDFDCEECVGSFLRGAFLACGSITEPEHSYHLELVVPYKKLATDLVGIIEKAGYEPKTIVRKGNNVIYFKDSEQIEYLLATMGAGKAALQLMHIKVEKDIKNQVNRKLNFEMSNMDKAVSAATRQLQAIKLIEEKGGGIRMLPEGLRELAQARLDDPEASLNELISQLETPLSKSGASHRFAKIIEIAKSLG